MTLYSRSPEGTGNFGMLRSDHARVTKYHLMTKDTSPVCNFCANGKGEMHHTRTVITYSPSKDSPKMPKDVYSPRSLYLWEIRLQYNLQESPHFELSGIIKFLGSRWSPLGQEIKVIYPIRAKILSFVIRLFSDSVSNVYNQNEVCIILANHCGTFEIKFAFSVLFNKV